jgi:hypothetical protein
MVGLAEEGWGPETTGDSSVAERGELWSIKRC